MLKVVKGFQISIEGYSQEVQIPTPSPRWPGHQPLHQRNRPGRRVGRESKGRRETNRQILLLQVNCLILVVFCIILRNLMQIIRFWGKKIYICPVNRTRYARIWFHKSPQRPPHTGGGRLAEPPPRVPGAALTRTLTTSSQKSTQTVLKQSASVRSLLFRVQSIRQRQRKCSWKSKEFPRNPRSRPKRGLTHLG